MKPNANLQTENVAEFLLFIFQIEAIIRSYGLDINLIDKEFLKPALEKADDYQLHYDWYRQLIGEMQQRQLHKEGHIEIVEEILIELIYLHNTLLTILNDEHYKNLCNQAHEALQAFKQKSNMSNRHDIEALLHAMFMKLQLKINKQQIGQQTESAMELFRLQLAYLSGKYKRMRSGELNFIQN